MKKAELMSNISKLISEAAENDAFPEIEDFTLQYDELDIEFTTGERFRLILLDEEDIT